MVQEEKNAAVNYEYDTKSYTIKDFYKSYLDEVESNGYVTIEYPLFRKVLEDYFEYLRDSVIEEGRIMTLPGRFGNISVRKYEGNISNIQYDYASSKLYGKPIWHFNDHTDGFRYKYYWNKSDLIVKNCTKYQMIFTRANKRRLAKILKSNERDYIGL